MPKREVILGAACMFGAHDQCSASRCECPCHRPKGVDSPHHDADNPNHSKGAP